jgi:hypothetical protein
MKQSVSVIGKKMPSPRDSAIEDADPNVFGSKAWSDVRKNETPEERKARQKAEMDAFFNK